MPDQDGLRFLFDIQDKISAKLAKIEAKSKASASKIDKAFTRASKSQQTNSSKAIASEQRRVVAVEKAHTKAVALLKRESDARARSTAKAVSLVNRESAARARATAKAVANEQKRIVSVEKSHAKAVTLLQRESDAFKRSMGRMAAAATVAFAAVAGKALQMAGGYDAAMRSVQAKTGATGALMDRLSDQSREMGRTTVHSATEAARGQAFLAQAGFDANEILEALPATLALATAGELDLASAADIASNVLQGFRLETAETGRVTDVLAAIAAKTNTSVSQMGVALAKAAPAAASAGWSLEQTAAAIGRLSDAGIQGEEAGTVLKTMLARLAAPTGKLEQLMTAAGISVKNATGRMLPLNDIIAQLAPHADNTGLMFELLGTRGANAGLILGSLASDDLHNLTSELEHSEGAAQRMADTMSGGLWGSLKEIQSIIESAYISLGERFTPAVKTLAAVFKKLPSPIQEVTVVVGSLAVAMGGLMVMMPGVFGALTNLPSKIGQVTVAFRALNLAMLINPFVLIASAIALAGVALYKFRKQLGLVGQAAAASIGEAEERVRSLATKVENSSGHMRRNLTRDLAAARAELGKLQTAEQDAGWAAFVASEKTRVLADVLVADVVPAVQATRKEFDRFLFKGGTTGSRNALMGFLGTLEALPPLGIEAAMATRALNLEFDRFPGGATGSRNALMGYLSTLQPLPTVVIEAEASSQKLNVTLAALAGQMGGASGQSLNLVASMIQTNDQLKEGEEGFSRIEIGASVAAAAFHVIGDAIGGTAGKILSSIGDIASAFATGGPIAAAIVGVGALVGALKGLFGVSKSEQAGRQAATGFRKGLMDGLSPSQMAEARTAVVRGLGSVTGAAVHIAIRDAKIAAGATAALAERTAAAMVRMLHRAEKHGPEAVARAQAAIQAILDAGGAATAEATAAAEQAAEKVRLAWEKSTSAVISAYDRAKQAGIDAYDKVYLAAIESGVGQEEASARATAAQEKASAKVLAIEKRKFIRLARFEAALEAIRSGNAAGAVAAANKAASETAAAWEISLDAVTQAHSVAMQGMADDTKASVTAQISYLGQLAGAAVGGGTVGGDSSYNKYSAGFGHLTDRQDWLRRNPGDDHRVDEALASQGPGRALGGPVGAGRPYMVGERGPELFVPSRSGRIEPNGSSGGGASAKDIARAVKDALEGMAMNIDGRKLGRLTVRHQPLAVAELGGRR